MKFPDKGFATIREWKNPSRSGGQREICLRLEAAIQDGGADDCDAMGPLWRPPHPLLLGHTSVSDLVDTTLRP